MDLPIKKLSFSIAMVKLPEGRCLVRFYVWYRQQKGPFSRTKEALNQATTSTQRIHEAFEYKSTFKHASYVKLNKHPSLYQVIT